MRTGALAVLRGGVADAFALLSMGRDDYVLAAAMLQEAEDLALKREEAHIEALSSAVITKLARATKRG